MKITGIFIIIISTVLYALIPPILKKTNSSLQPFTIMSFSMLVLFLISLVFSLVFEKSWGINFSQQKNNILLLILVGIINALGFWLAIVSYKFMPLWQQSLFGLLSPILVSVFAYFILGEALSLKLFIGLLVMGSGLFIAIK